MGIQWRDSLAIGVTEIDDQHKELLLRFDRLLKACQAGRGAAELAVLQTSLEEYILTHFSDEEALQRQHSFPGYETHKNQHQYFINQIKKLRAETEAQGISLHHVVETNDLLLKWLITHISKVDRELGRFLNSEGT